MALLVLTELACLLADVSLSNIFSTIECGVCFLFIYMILAYLWERVSSLVVA